MPWPMPRLAPVMSATLPWSFIFLLLWSVLRCWTATAFRADAWPTARGQPRWVQVRKNVIVNSEREIEPHHVGVGRRAEHGQAHPEAVADGDIDRLGVAYAFVDQGERLTPQGVLHTVGNETRHVFLDAHRDFAGVAQQVENEVHASRRREFGANHFHQGNQERGLVKMRPQNALAVRGAFANPGDADY